MNLKKIILSMFLLAPLMVWAQKDLDKILKSIDDKSEQYGKVSQQIWNYAEVGYQEEQSSALLQSELKKAGFTIESGVAGMPTAFVATYGSGKPVIGILGEFDALPGLSQKGGVPEKS